MQARADGMEQAAVMVEDVEAIAMRNFDEQRPIIYLRTIARGVAKYLLYKKAKEKKGEVAGLLVNAFNVASESADIRAWLSLPNSFEMIRMRLAPGEYNVHLTFYDARGRQIRVADIPHVVINRGGFRIISYRTYQ